MYGSKQKPAGLQPGVAGELTGRRRDDERRAEKIRTWDQPGGTLCVCHLPCGKNLTRSQARRRRHDAAARARGRGGWPAEALALSVLPMTDVTRILSAIEQGDPRAA